MTAKVGRSVARPVIAEEQDDLVLSSPNFAQKYPSLYELLAKSRQSEKYHPRGCLTIFWEDGVFKVSMNDRPNCQTTFVSHQELGGAFLIGDRGIRSKTLRWRRNKRYAASAKNVFV